ncbi:MAG: methyltransferase domain-containing protein [Solirubrobacterales bacterium]|nr:methyltransferase domain-containing protein [Solirubrobacterales bacterium]
MSETNIPPFSTRARVAAEFDHPEVVTSYRFRPEPPAQTFDILAGLITDAPRVVLDIGCGTGFLARPLVSRVDRLDAVDMSPAMIAEGKRLLGGNDPRLRWVVGRIEDAPLDPPYALVTAGDALGWMDWDVLLPRLADALTPAGLFASVTLELRTPAGLDAFGQGLRALRQRYIRTPWRSAPLEGFDLSDELQRRNLFREVGRATTDVVPFRQPADDFVRSYHGRASNFLHRLPPEEAAAFDAALRQLIWEHIGPEVQLSVWTDIVWGRPLRP